jgi:hypothetical protein
MNNHITNGRVARWFLFLQEFDITFLDELRKGNVLIDSISKTTNEGDVIPIEYAFLDEYLFSFSINTLWFEDISNYLSIWKLPQHLSPR